MNIVVIGVGQSLRGDDAAGLEAVRRWQKKYPETASTPGIHTEASELPGLSLLDLLEGAEAAVIVDAVQSSAPPGTLHSIGPDNLVAFTPDTGSAHGWGVAETLQLGRRLSPALANCRITLIGIEVSQVEMGTGLSREVESSLGNACDLIEKEVRDLL